MRHTGYYKHMTTVAMQELPEWRRSMCISTGDGGWVCPVEEIPLDKEFLTRLRACMRRWCGRYAGTKHAGEHTKETMLLIQEIDEKLLCQ